MGLSFAPLRLLIVFAAFATLSASAASANTIYTIHDSDLPLLVDGSISTDGKIGALASADIIGWDLSISGVGATPVTLTETNSILTLDGSSGDLTATPSALLWDFNSDGMLQFLLQQGTFSAFVSYNDLFVIGEKFFLGCCVDPGGIQRFNIEPIATTPVPPTLPLFATGLGLIAVLGWSRRHGKDRLAGAYRFQ